MTPALAFYRGRGTASDRVIRWVTRSEFSHVEYVPAPPLMLMGAASSWSASARDGGVRWKVIDFQPDRWSWVHLNWLSDTHTPLSRIAEELGAPYDFAGLLGAQLLNLRRSSARRWFCSEICAHALGLPEPQIYSPGGLYHLARWRRGRALLG